MKKHLIALDLDGTLLKDDKTISSRTKNTLEHLISDGHKVVIATGRPHRASKVFYNELRLNTPMVNFNGALIHHPGKSESFRSLHSPLPRKVAKEILYACEEIGVINTMFEVKDQFYLRYADRGFADAFTMNQKPMGTGPLHDFLREDPTSILIHPATEHLAMTRSQFKDLIGDEVNQRSWGAPWHVLEMVRSDVHKAFGLKKIANYFAIDQEQVIAFGDEDNDLEMIEYAGTGVAMGNGIDELKSIAKDMTLTNEEDGISVYLEKYFGLS
ncbi:Cof-type HAD-IIB family hydrolase [Salisediminibacterium beveridgei]|uniref:Haloacid dehalogenase n=1 Tax=Salisediminibacterium beveridgei TaxID=632773 RepID=A0A1D7QWK1_9BACI|nr:Cof-type HAD-IIB family hydrolase [Salisediminibacterium beveridgei]AOM83397.1 haloacid dehalogenase [Salisediminibacterium beveridgei]